MSMMPARSRNAACSLREPVEVRRRRPAERALIGAGAAPRLAGLEVVGALPAVLRRRRRARLLEAGVQRAGALRAAPTRRRRAGIAAGSSTCTSRARPRRRRRRRGRCAEAPGAVRRRRRARSHPPVIHSAIALPMPPAPPNPLSDSPAAIQKPGTPGTGPSSGLRVGRHRIGVADEPGDARRRRGTGSAAPRPPSAPRSARGRPAAARAVLPRAPSIPARRRVRLVAAEQHAA